MHTQNKQTELVILTPNKINAEINVVGIPLFYWFLITIE